MYAMLAPAVLNRPPLNLGDGHERDERETTCQIGIISTSDGMILENEGDDVGVDDDFHHAAGSVRLWPRHSWRASRKSSMDSSSGQRSPCSTETSAIGLVPCSAMSCSTDGCPVAEYNTRTSSAGMSR